MSAARPSWRLLGTLLRGRRGRLALLGLLLAVSSALPLAGPQLLRAFIDQAVAGRPIAALALIAGAYVAVALSGQALAVTAATAPPSSPGRSPMTCAGSCCATPWSSTCPFTAPTRRES